MFIYNFKLNSKVLYISIILLVATFLISLNFIELFHKDVNTIPKEKLDYMIDTENFAATIKAIHENIPDNIGKKVEITGFVFRMPDFDKKYFVCGRNMIVNGEDKVAGILCEYDKCSEYEDGNWVKLRGEIIEGKYIDTMPVIKVTAIEKIKEYSDSYVVLNKKESI